MAYPVVSENLAAFWQDILANDSATTLICGLGDSKTTDSSTNANLPYGLGNQLEGVPFSCRGVRAEQGPPAWSATIAVDAGSGTGSNVAAGGTLAAGTGSNPIAAWQKTYSANRQWFAPVEWSATLANLSQYGNGDWTAGVTVRARIIYFAHANSLPNARLEGRRGSTVIATVALDMTANPGTVQFADVTCGTAAGDPVVALRVNGTSSPDYDETGKSIQILGAFFFVADANGNRIPGTGTMAVATGGNTTATLLSQLGGGVSPVNTAARVKEWLAAHKVGQHGPTHFIIDVFQNRTTTEASELDAGTITAAAANAAAIVSHVRTLVDWCDPRFLLCAPYASAYSETANKAMVAAMFAAKAALPNPKRVSVCATYYLLGRQPSGNNAITADGIHPSTNGSQNWAGALLAAGRAALDVPDQRTFRNGALQGGG